MMGRRDPTRDADARRRLRMIPTAIAWASVVAVTLAGCAPEAPRQDTATDDVYTPTAAETARDPERNVTYATDILDVMVSMDADPSLVRTVAEAVDGSVVGSVPDVGLYQIRLDEAMDLSSIEALADTLEERFADVSQAAPETLMAAPQAADSEAQGERTS